MSLRNRDRGECPDKDFWLRRVSLLGKALPVMTDLRPGEHLQGGILRAAASNGISHTGRIIELAGTSTFRSLSAFTTLEDSGEIERLVDVLGIRPQSEKLLEVLKAPGSRTRQHVSFFGHVVRRAHISPLRRVSPRALAAQGYQRAIWSLRPFEFDPGTREMLLSDCPVCERALGWARTEGVVYCESCPRRSVDLRNFPQQLIQPEDEEAIEFVGAIINPEVTDIEFSKWRSSALGNASRGDLFQLVVKTASECQRAETGWYSTAIAFKHLERAGRAVLGWPKSFIALAETIVPSAGSIGAPKEQPLWRLRHDLTINPDVRRRLKTLYHNSRNRSIAARYDAQAEEKSGLSVPHARDSLRSPQVELKRLLSGRSSRDAVGDVEAKITALRNIHDVQRMSVSLGMPVFDVYELYTEGLLPELTAVLTDCGFPEPSGRARPTLRQIIDAMPITSSPTGENAASVRFALDLQLTAPWSRVFSAMSKAEVFLCRARPSGRGIVHDLYVDDPKMLGSLLDAPQHRHLPSSLSVTQSELAMCMGKSISMAARFVKLTGLNARLTLGRIQEQRDNWITSFELRILLQRRGIDPSEIATVLRSASVPFRNHKSIFLWAREDTTKLFGLQ